MNRLIAAAMIAICTCSGAANAQDSSPDQGRVKLGYGRLITNDFIGDTQDRWRTGSVAASRIWGRGWNGALPEQFGDILELRLGGQIIAPDNLTSPAAGDRPYATSVSLGLHTHFARGAVEFAVGADLVMTGDQTGLRNFQDGLHDALGVDGTSATTRAGMIGNDFHPTVVIEAGREFTLNSGARLRPFVEGRAGDETLIRAGADLTIGQTGLGELLIRDVVSGQRYRAVSNRNAGKSFVLGGDIAHVADSIYLPESAGYALSDMRTRLRAGVHWQGEKTSGFYGLTYLGEEFKGQDGGQVVGSVRLKLDF